MRVIGVSLVVGCEGCHRQVVGEVQGAAGVTHLPSLSPQPPPSLWASVCWKLLNVESALNRRDYIENPTVRGALKREERARGRPLAWMQRKTHRKFKLGDAITWAVGKP